MCSISSGNSAINTCSIRSFCATASSTEIPASRTVVPTIAPSPSFGRNSPPMREAISAAPMNNATAPSSVSLRNRSARPSAGS